LYAQEKVDNLYFSLNVPDNWTYAEYSLSGIATILGRGPVNYLIMAPAEFSNILFDKEDESNSAFEKISNGGAFSEMYQDTNFPVKNAPLKTYVNYKQRDNATLNITSQTFTTIGKEDAVRVVATDTVLGDNVKFLRYMVLHDNEAYNLLYAANIKDYDKYLPEFEQMVKSFRFE
jgi:hypothetical protein